MYLPYFIFCRKRWKIALGGNLRKEIIVVGDRWMCLNIISKGINWFSLLEILYSTNRYVFICLVMRWVYCLYHVVQIWPGQTVTCLHTNSPGHIWTTLYITAQKSLDVTQIQHWMSPNSCASLYRFAVEILVVGSVEVPEIYYLSVRVYGWKWGKLVNLFTTWLVWCIFLYGLSV
jgi:hypothetical protein